MLLLGEKIPAEQAYQWGLVSHLLPAPPEFHSQADKILDEIMSLPPVVCFLFDDWSVDFNFYFRSL